MTTALQKAEMDRSIIEEKVARITQKLKVQTTWNNATIKHYNKMIADAQECLENILRRISYQDPDDITSHYKKHNEIIDEIDQSVLLLIEKSDELETPSPPPLPPQQPRPVSVKLPQIELPTFSGDCAEWTSFSDLFKSTIHIRTDISDSLRLQYLKGAVKNEAAELIKHLLVTNSNYKTAWDMLEQRYNNKREIVHTLLKRLFSQPHFTKESASDLRKLHDTTTECLRSLKVLGRPVDHWDDFIIYILVERLDPETRRQWALQQKGTNLPILQDLLSFLDQHARNIQACTQLSSSHPTAAAASSTTASHYSSHYLCPLCQQAHQIFNCPTFQAATPVDRSKLVKKVNHCTNCLRNHKLDACTSTSTCKQCGGKHHTSLHFGTKATPTNQTTSNFASHATSKIGANAQFDANSSSPTTSHNEDSGTHTQSHFTSIHENSQIILGTALAGAKDSTGKLMDVRILLDSGSGCTMITEQCANALGLSRQKSNIIVNGIGQTRAGLCRGETQLTLFSQHNKFTITIQALIFGHITGNVPSTFIQHKDWSHLKGLKLADPEYYKPGHVDILLDADYTNFIMTKGKRRGPRYSPTAFNSQLGWVLSGRVNKESKPTQLTITANHTHCELENLVKNFWEIESIPEVQHLTPEEQFCEEHFRDTHKRDKNGRFMVQLPFNNNISKLGASQDMAIRRFHQVERRLSKRPDIKQEYINFMKEYISLGHMEEISGCEVNETVGKTNYLPHHFVVKEDSSTTKLRVVFNASARTSTGISLNDTMCVGATVQAEIFAILLKFRLFPIVLKADIAKMYRQFLVEKSHCDYLRIVWHESPDQPIKHYRLLTVTYGTSSAPFLATRCLQQLAFENKNLPLAYRAISNETYVDDCITGATSIENAVETINQLNSVCESAGLTLRKWCSNNPVVLQNIPQNLCESEETYDLDKFSAIKTLGVKWQSSSDNFLFSAQLRESTRITKRLMLSELARVYDPIGLISPVTVVGKILFQRVWQVEKLNWESLVPATIANEWNSYKLQLHNIEQCKINRCVFPNHNNYFELHGFSDASEHAYGAVIYIRYQDDDGQFHSNMITSKARVAPLKRLSIERLELCGAALLSELMTSVVKIYNFNCPIFAWTDSTIVLRYISAHPSRWKTFVAHKVAKIQTNIPPEHWRHVSGADNPADLASRGISALTLCSSLLWWQGPSWLCAQQLPLSSPLPMILVNNLEEKKKAILANHVTLTSSIISKYSCVIKLKRVTAYIFRVVQRARKVHRENGPLTPDELSNALKYWIHHEQLTFFHNEIKSLQSNIPLKKKSTILSLNPFLDERGLLRVGGRVQNAEMSHDQKHQLILPHQSLLTKLIIRNAHHVQYHAGFQLTWAHLQLQYWFTRGRSTIRSVIRKCVVCRRHNAERQQQLMGALPTTRTTPSHPFSYTGIDYAGPFHIANMKGRRKQNYKAYFAIFVCFSTKAIHLEVVSDLTTEAFIASLKRFIARRGLCQHIYSDCGTNFVGADRELKQLFSSSQHHNQISDHLSTIGIKWSFNTPGAPHQGGLWEAGVKSVKNHLKRILTETPLTFEEFQTVLCQVEACLNSRPLCAANSDPSDFTPLTPGHFLIGRPLTALPDPDVTHIKMNRLSRWQLCQQVLQHWWKRWRNEYVSSLQQRFKWQAKRDNLCINDLVLLNDENSPPARWKLGRVIDTKLGSNNCVRVVTIKTNSGVYERSITKITPLLCSSDQEESECRE